MPKGDGPKGGSGVASSKPKASPIARPSTDYANKIASRDYLGSKEQREEARKLEIEERKRQREAGVDVDLGKAGVQWEAAAGGAKQPLDAGKSSSGGKGKGKSKRGNKKGSGMDEYKSTSRYGGADYRDQKDQSSSPWENYVSDVTKNDEANDMWDFKNNCWNANYDWTAEESKPHRIRAQLMAKQNSDAYSGWSAGGTDSWYAESSGTSNDQGKWHSSANGFSEHKSHASANGFPEYPAHEPAAVTSRISASTVPVPDDDEVADDLAALSVDGNGAHEEQAQQQRHERLVAYLVFKRSEGKLEETKKGLLQLVRNPSPEQQKFIVSTFGSLSEQELERAISVLQKRQKCVDFLNATSDVPGACKQLRAAAAVAKPIGAFGILESEDVEWAVQTFEKERYSPVPGPEAQTALHEAPPQSLVPEPSSENPMKSKGFMYQ